MSFSTVARLAVSGLDVAQTQLAVSAGNVANLNTPNYRPARVTSQSLPNGGAAAIVTLSGAGAPEAAGAEAPSGTDLTTELVDQRVALRGYEANLAALKAANDREKRLLSVFA